MGVSIYLSGNNSALNKSTATLGLHGLLEALVVVSSAVLLLLLCVCACVRVLFCACVCVCVCVGGGGLLMVSLRSVGFVVLAAFRFRRSE